MYQVALFTNQNAQTKGISLSKSEKRYLAQKNGESWPGPESQDKAVC